MTFTPEQHSQPLLRTVLGSLREGIVVLDHDTNVVLYNRAASEIFKIRENSKSPRLLRLVDITRHKTIHQGFRQILEGSPAFESEIELLNGQTRTFNFRATPYQITSESGEVLNGAVGVFVDVTKLVLLEGIRREFFTNLSHELRTPLTSILVYVETLLNGAIYDIEYNVEFLNIIDKHAKRMLALVKDISNLSAIEAGEISLSFREISLKPLVDNLASLHMSDLEDRELTFTNAVAPDTVVYADLKSLEQILTNLVVNAIKFNRPKGNITVEARAEDDEFVVVSVKDTGIGIEADHLPRIFERLYRADKSRSREIDGSGLGLAIVKHLVIANQGDISVESTPQIGSEFHIRLRRPRQ